MDPRNIDLSLSSTDEAGHTTRFDANFDGQTLPWSELNGVFNAAAGQIRELTHVVPTKSQGMASPARREPLDFPEDHQSGNAAPRFPAPKPKLMAEINIDAGLSFVDESHPQADRLREFFGEQLTEAGATVPEDWKAKDYGVGNLTAGEVQQLLEQKDLELGRLRSRLDTAEKAQSDMNDLRREANRQAELSERESAALREAVTGLQQTNAALNKRNAELNADLKTRRQNVLDLAKQRDHLQHRNQNQERSLKEMRAKLDLYESGAPGVADLQLKYEELVRQVSKAADDHTRLQDERDIARQERNRAIKDYNDLLAVHEDLKDQFTDQTERLNNSQRELRAAQLETKEYERRCDLKDAKARAAANERNREQEKVENYERRLEQVQTTVAAVIESIQADTSAHIQGGTSAPVSEMIHKSDALEAVKAITETIGKPFPEVP